MNVQNIKLWFLYLFRSEHVFVEFVKDCRYDKKEIIESESKLSLWRVMNFKNYKEIKKLGCSALFNMNGQLIGGSKNK